jgi:uncharacterized membrane protein
MWKESLLNMFNNNRGKCIGTILGLAVAVFVLVIGFFKTLFISLCILIGFYIGKKVDNKESILDIIERIIPNEWK